MAEPDEIGQSGITYHCRCGASSAKQRDERLMDAEGWGVTYVPIQAALGIAPHWHLRGRNFRVKPPPPPQRFALDAAARHVASNPGCCEADIGRALLVTRQRAHQLVERLVSDGLARAEKRPGRPSRVFPPDA